MPDRTNAARIAAELLYLRQIAIEHDLLLVAYLIAMAAVEAENPTPLPPDSPLREWLVSTSSGRG